MGKVKKVAVAWTALTAVWIAWVLIHFSNTVSGFGTSVRTNDQSNALKVAIIIYIVGLFILAVVKWVSSDKSKQVPVASKQTE
jgi:hypothetical protein